MNEQNVEIEEGRSLELDRTWITTLFYTFPTALYGESVEENIEAFDDLSDWSFTKLFDDDNYYDRLVKEAQDMLEDKITIKWGMRLTSKSRQDKDHSLDITYTCNIEWNDENSEILSKNIDIVVKIDKTENCFPALQKIANTFTKKIEEHKEWDLTRTHEYVLDYFKSRVDPEEIGEVILN